MNQTASWPLRIVRTDPQPAVEDAVTAPPWNALVLDQVQYINKAFGDQLCVQEDGAGGVLYMCANDEILVREEHSDEVSRLLSVDQAGIEWITRGVVRHKLAGSNTPVFSDAIDKVQAARGTGVAAPNHVLTVAPSGPCPATEPQQVYFGIEPYPAVQGDGGDGVLMYIADTGLVEDTVGSCPWLAGVTRAQLPSGAGPQDWDIAQPTAQSGGQAGTAPDPKQQATPSSQNLRKGGLSRAAQAAGFAPSLATLARQQTIGPYGGHGTFVAGVARCMAPKANVIVSNIFKTAGSALESDFVKDLDRALDLGVDIFNLSITAPTMNDRPLLAFARWLENAQQSKGVACLAAAGNSGLRTPSWPAAHPGVIGVGALAADWRSRAAFSNYGAWVDVYAPGRNLVNALAIGTYKCYVDPYAGDSRLFYGMARWSGTSFSTPLVSGLIAARMSSTGENGAEAAAALLAQARAQAVPGTGPILLPYGRSGR
jgi:hypothetical protein